MIRTREELQDWLAEGERMAAEFDWKAASVRWFWIRRYYRKMAADVRTEMEDAKKEFAEWAYYEAVARASYEASQDVKLPLPLRQYYAAVALWADKKSNPTVAEG